MNDIKNIKLLHQELPNCPFIWTYNGFMFPIRFVQKVQEHEIQLSNELKNILKKYACDYYRVEQEVLNIDGNTIKVANISFHSWLFSKINPTINDMTNSKLNVQIMSSLIPFDDTEYKQIGKYGIEINSFGKKRVHIHNNRLSPKYDNAIKLETFPKEFVTICIHEKSGTCCVTKHRLFYL